MIRYRWFRRTPLKYLSDLGRCFAANVIATAFKFGNRRAFEFFQRFLARNRGVISHGTNLTQLNQFYSFIPPPKWAHCPRPI